MSGYAPFQSDLWHRRTIGKLPDGAWAAFLHGGQVYRVGKATYMRILFLWDDGSTGDAVVRVYALARPDEASGGQYDALLCYAWTLTYDELIRIPGHELVPDDVMTAMRVDPNMRVDTDWYVRDGFECTVDVVPAVARVDIGRGGRVTPHLPAGVNKCPGKVTVVLEGRSDLATIVGYDEWPAGVALENWHADPDFVKDLTKAKGFSKLLPLGADKAGPPLSVSLGGGPEHPIGSGRMLVREKSQVLVRGYSFKRPGSNILEYISLEGDLYADPVTGSRMFDERAASALSAARPLLKPAPRNRAWLYDKYLLPSVDGANLLTIPRAWLGADEVITVSPSLSMAAAQALGVDNYFTFELAVDGNGELLPSATLDRAGARATAIRSFLPAGVNLQTVHAALQRTLETKLLKWKWTPSCEHVVSPFPYAWYLLVQQAIGADDQPVTGNASVRDTRLTPRTLDKLYGARSPPSPSPPPHPPLSWHVAYPLLLFSLPFSLPSPPPSSPSLILILLSSSAPRTRTARAHAHCICVAPAHHRSVGALHGEPAAQHARRVGAGARHRAGEEAQDRRAAARDGALQLRDGDAHHQDVGPPDEWWRPRERRANGEVPGARPAGRGHVGL